jgi:multidrug efflux pump subunit AcrA (membrane-fusion protein)
VTRRTAVLPVVIIAVLVVAATLTLAFPSALPTGGRSSVPTARVVHTPLKLTVYATGELRAGRTLTLVAPPAGGMLRLVKLLPTGTSVKAGDVVFEFDPADQEYNLEQQKSDLAEAEQQIVKSRADTAVQESQDKLDLLTARYDVRRAELASAANEFIGSIEAQKNQLTLDEAQRRLAQLEKDISSRTATNAAALAVLDEKRNKALLSMKRAQSIIDSLVVRSPIDGVVAVKDNRDMINGFFFSGMVIPEYREGDTTSSGRPIADVVEAGRMQVRAKVNETDRDNLAPGQTATVQVDSLPGRTFTAKVGALSGLASRGSFFETTAVRQFDVTFQLDQPDPAMRAGASVRLVIDGRELKDALHIPRQAIFEKAGKTFVYLKNGDGFEKKDVRVVNSTESRAVINGLSEGDVVALVDPDLAARRTTSSAPAMPAGGGSR